MCDSNMKYKPKYFFINLTLILLFGCLTKVESFAEDNLLGTLAESTYSCDNIPELEETSLSETSVLPQTNTVYTLRHFQKRINSSSSTKYGIATIKKNYPLYTSLIVHESARRFPSGLTKARRHLISLGKLII